MLQDSRVWSIPSSISSMPHSAAIFKNLRSVDDARHRQDSCAPASELWADSTMTKLCYSFMTPYWKRGNSLAPVRSAMANVSA